MTARRLIVPLLIFAGAVAPGMAAAQGARAASPAPSDAVDPLRCWWRTSAGAVATGEMFTATLTCAARDDAAARAVVDESRLVAASVQLQPFEVLGGSHPPDVRSATHRFFQYHYDLRVIDRDLIGGEAQFPDLQVSYRVATPIGGDESNAGRERVYIVRGGRVRVLSLVPGEAGDIRDSDGADLAVIAGLRFRSQALQLLAAGLVALGLLVLVSAVAATVARRAAPRARDPHQLSDATVLRAAIRALEAVRQEAQGGWSADLVDRAAAATRVVASCAAGDPVPVVESATAGAPAVGVLAVTLGVARRTQRLVSSAMTPAALTRRLGADAGLRPAADAPLLDALRRALATFTERSYARAFDASGEGLDEALATAARAAAQMRDRSGVARRLQRSLSLALGARR